MTVMATGYQPVIRENRMIRAFLPPFLRHASAVNPIAMQPPLIRLLLPLLLAPAILAAAPAKMNVLLIISDDMRAELGCYGRALAKTPNLDHLASTGVKFDRAYCQYPLCNPSRASMLTGRFPATTGVLGNRTWFGDAHPDFVSLPKYFKANGYVTVRVGKIFHGGIDDTDAWSENGQVRTLAGVSAASAAQPIPMTRRHPPTRNRRN